MKTIGLIGGTSWSSTIEYYRYINEEVCQKLGGLHSARLVLTSIEFAEFEAAMHSNRWDVAAGILKNEAKRLEVAKVDVILLCSNLIHKMFDEVKAATRLPFIHIADALGDEVKERGYKTVALLGARQTMEEDFYAGRIRERSGANVIIPSANEITYIDNAIFGRMCRNVYTEEDRAEFGRIISRLKDRGAEGVILGCTELPVLLHEAPLTLLSSTYIHSKKAVEWALKAG